MHLRVGQVRHAHRLPQLERGGRAHLRQREMAIRSASGRLRRDQWRELVLLLLQLLQRQQPRKRHPRSVQLHPGRVSQQLGLLRHGRLLPLHVPAVGSELRAAQPQAVKLHQLPQQLLRHAQLQQRLLLQRRQGQLLLHVSHRLHWAHLPGAHHGQLLRERGLLQRRHMHQQQRCVHVLLRARLLRHPVSAGQLLSECAVLERRHLSQYRWQMRLLLSRRLHRPVLPDTQLLCWHHMQWQWTVRQ